MARRKNRAVKSDETESVPGSLIYALRGAGGSISLHLREYLALAATLIAFGIVVVKVILVSADGDSALAVLRASGPVEVLTGTVAEGRGFFFGIAAVEATSAVIRARRLRYAQSKVLIRQLILALLLALMLALQSCSSVVTLLVILGGLTLGWHPAVASQTELPQRGWEAAVPRAALMFLVTAGLFFLILNGDMWLPAEVIEDQSGGVTTGYVLQDEGEWTVILEEEARTVLLMRSEEISTRRVCRPSDSPEKPSLVQVLIHNDLDRVPACTRIDGSS